MPGTIHSFGADIFAGGLMVDEEYKYTSVSAYSNDTFELILGSINSSMQNKSGVCLFMCAEKVIHCVSSR